MLSRWTERRVSKSKAQPRTIAQTIASAFRKVVAGKLSPDQTVQVSIAFELGKLRAALERVATSLEEDDERELEDLEDHGPTAPFVNPPGFEGMPPPSLTPDQVKQMIEQSEFDSMVASLPALLRVSNPGELADQLDAGDVAGLEVVNAAFVAQRKRDDVEDLEDSAELEEASNEPG